MVAAMSLFSNEIQEDFDPIYKHLATLEQYADRVSEETLQGKLSCRQKICELWAKHQHKLDGYKSQQEIKKHFNSVYWELYLCELLMSLGFNFDERNPTGPDIKCTHPNIQGDVYFEAISVKSGEGNNNAQIPYTNVSELKDGQSIPVKYYDADLLKLRITQGIQGKANKFRKYLDNGVIPNAGFLIPAIHYSREMGFLSGISGLTVFHESVFPLGPISVTFDTQTYKPKPIRVQNIYSPIILKHNGAEIDCCLFLSDTSSHISGLLFSDISYTSNEAIDSSIGFIHNPVAGNPFPKGLFSQLGYREWEAVQSKNNEEWEIFSL